MEIKLGSSKPIRVAAPEGAGRPLNTDTRPPSQPFAKTSGGSIQRARFTEEQIIGILKAAEVGGNVRVACRDHNVMEPTFYRWRNKYGGMDLSEPKKLREVERENGELKKRVADPSLDNRMLKELNSKKW